MAHRDDIALIAHLMRRAGFGAGRDELEARVAKGYDATVDELLNPEAQPPVDHYTLLRHQPSALLPGGVPPMGNVNYMYYLVTTQRPLEEKMALFWHHVLATGNSKVDNYDQILEQIDLFRNNGMGNYRDLLLKVAKNPSMIFWLDNNQNHGTAVNETKLPRLPYGRFPWKFQYRPEDHDEGEKTFLGHTGNFNGEDIIDIVVEQPACAKFICRHLYNFFVADEPQVPAWNLEPPRDPAAVDTLMKSFRQNKYEMKPVLRTLFTSDFFKNARYKHLKSPAEVVVGTLRQMGGFEIAKPGYGELSMQPSYMGQDLLNPPSVEGWHTGQEWINSGSLMARINFVAEQVGNTSSPGVQSIIKRLRAMGVLAPEQMVDTCLDLLGPIEVGPVTKKELVDQAKEWGEIRWDTAANAQAATKRTGELLQLIVATREYQFA
jgi:hypothetical protein